MAALRRLIRPVGNTIARARGARSFAAGPVNGTDLIFNEDHVAMRESLHV